MFNKPNNVARTLLKGGQIHALHIRTAVNRQSCSFPSINQHSYIDENRASSSSIKNKTSLPKVKKFRLSPPCEIGSNKTSTNCSWKSLFKPYPPILNMKNQHVKWSHTTNEDTLAFDPSYDTLEPLFLGDKPRQDNINYKLNIYNHIHKNQAEDVCEILKIFPRMEVTFTSLLYPNLDRVGSWKSTPY